VKYLTPEQVLFLHSRIIDETGGAHGVRDVGLLKSALGRPHATFGAKDLYPDIFHKASALMESLVNNHPFIDGNKRTAIASASLFLRQNGLLLESTQEAIETFTLDIALKNITIREATVWLEQHTIRLNK
jgi:death-on-curing protein